MGDINMAIKCAALSVGSILLLSYAAIASGVPEEIWFSGVNGDIFGDPDRMGEGAAELNLAARPICEKLGIGDSWRVVLPKGSLSAAEVVRRSAGETVIRLPPLQAGQPVLVMSDIER